ncbi:MAG: prephenate/arogenate dehydrogenase [Leptolyngbyaceae cyanobacterium RU_5_1]|nr:prephenate/arogenate dehydrogenase [Leptolyngbyaceae cyanobacterium RU_5_1]
MNIGIVGLGLIGGSLGLDFRQHGHRVLGVSRKPQTCARAIARGAVDEASVNLKLVQPADVVFICTPLAAMEATVIELIPHLSPATVLTDVGSVKGWVMAAIAPLWANFVGGHPMAGTAESGIEAALPNLFAGRPYVLTPTETTPPEAVNRVAELIRSLQAHIYHCYPDEHDRAVAWISHLPVMVSTSLIAACLHEDESGVLELAKALASSGFRDTSRVGGGNPELGVMMARYNTAALVRSLYTFRDSLNHLITKVEQHDWQALEEMLERSQQARPVFVNHQ